MELERIVSEERQRWRVPGIAAALLRDGWIEEAAEGVASIATGEPVRADTRFRIASITKPFTASLALSLAGDGLLDLDEPLAAGATPRQLLSHQGGLACEWPRPLDGYGASDDALVRLAEDGPDRRPFGPGELYAYSNAGYWLVGAAIARAAGTSFEEAMRERVLEPLGLDRTSFSAAGAAVGHVPVEPGGEELEPALSGYPRVRHPSGGLCSTAGDLLRFADHLAGAETMRAPLIDAPGGAYGLGLWLRESNGRRIAEHGGSVLGFETRLTLVPGEGVALAVLTNATRGAGAIRGILERLGLGIEEPPEAALAAAELEALAGVYRERYGEASVTVSGGRLRIELTEIDPFEGRRLAYPPVHARPAGDGVFVLVDGDDRGTLLDFPRPGLLRAGSFVGERS